MPLDFLNEVARGALPVAVTCPKQLRHVTRLKATGLIEATLAITHSRQRATTAAFVHRLTEEGRREIGGSTVRPPKNDDVGLTFLRFLEFVDFPVFVTQASECNLVADLVKDGLIYGAVDEGLGGSREAVVRGLTSAGRAKLLPRPEASSEGLAAPALDPFPSKHEASTGFTRTRRHVPAARSNEHYAMSA